MTASFSPAEAGRCVCIKRFMSGEAMSGSCTTRFRPLFLEPKPADCYAVVLIRVPTEPEVALVCSTSPDRLPSLSPSLSTFGAGGAWRGVTIA
jgi:hypothetical protein